MQLSSGKTIWGKPEMKPKIKLKIRLHKELKNKKQKQEAFRKKMKELEIK